MSNKCSPKKDCNVCKECCQDYIENGEECDKCFEENCQNYCDTSVKDVDVDVELDDDGNPTYSLNRMGTNAGSEKFSFVFEGATTIDSSKFRGKYGA